MRMNMRFKLKAADLIRALNIVGNVTPSPVTTQGGAGYLFKAYLKDGLPRCHVYSRDQTEVARADIKLLELDGEGSFIAPPMLLAGIQYIPDDEIDFDVKTEGPDYAVQFKSTSEAHKEMMSFDPRFISPIDDDFEAAGQKKTFAAGILREAISLSKKFIADAKDTRAEDHLKTVQIFDETNEAWAKGNGNMYATNGTKAFWFYSEAFKNDGVAIHGAHLDRLGAFLSKCEGPVEIRHGKHMMFAANEIKNKEGNVEGEQVFGWAFHSKTHSKYSYLPLKHDQYVFRMAKVTLMNALNFTRSGLETNRDKIHIQYKASEKKLYFTASDGGSKTGAFPVPVEVQLAEEKDFQYNLNITQLIELIGDLKGHEVLFRVLTVPPDDRRPKGAAMFRTIDEFWMNNEGKVIGGSSTEKDEAGNEKRPEGGSKCRVTRFMPSKD
jgi:hypothetical protein